MNFEEIDVLGFVFLGVSIGIWTKALLILFMVSMGLSLAPSNFQKLVQYPKAAAVGIVGQIVFLPILGFLIAYAYQLDAALAIGLIVIAVCPGGATSNFITYLAKGDLALSIALTAISGVLTLFTVPFLVNLGLEMYAKEGEMTRLPVLITMWNIFILTVFPVACAMLFRNFYKNLARNIEKILFPINILLLILLWILYYLQVENEIWDMIKLSWLPVLSLNIGAMLAGFFTAKIMGLNRQQGRTIAIEIGFQNYVLAIVITVNLLNRPEYALVPLIYLFAMYATGIFTIWLSRFSDRVRGVLKVSPSQ